MYCVKWPVFTANDDDEEEYDDENNHGNDNVNNGE